AQGFVALYVFMLAAIAGHVIISRVPVILHTPLMSGSNFIHGIVLVGAMVVLGHADTTLEKAIGFVAVLLGAGNAAGRYVVPQRRCSRWPARAIRAPPPGSCSAGNACPRRAPRARAPSGPAPAWCWRRWPRCCRRDCRPSA